MRARSEHRVARGSRRGEAQYEHRQYRTAEDSIQLPNCINGSFQNE